MQEEDATEGRIGKKRVHRLTKKKSRGKKMQQKEE
jgi:hypothetical protein